MMLNMGLCVLGRYFMILCEISLVGREYRKVDTFVNEWGYV